MWKYADARSQRRWEAPSDCSACCRVKRGRISGPVPTLNTHNLCHKRKKKKKKEEEKKIPVFPGCIGPYVVSFSGCRANHVSLSWFSPGLVYRVRRDTQRYRQRLIGLRCPSLSHWARPAAHPRPGPSPSFHVSTQRLCSHVLCSLIVGHSLVEACLRISLLQQYTTLLLCD